MMATVNYVGKWLKVQGFAIVKNETGGWGRGVDAAPMRRLYVKIDWKDSTAVLFVALKWRLVFVWLFWFSDWLANEEELKCT
ncbi:hypothetical protein BH11PLA1_BH11PLA1_17540 [soil metagenome]